MPLIVPLTAGQPLARTFSVLAGDACELRLISLSAYTYSTGQAVITAVSGADVYVQWVRTGSVTRVN